MTGVQTCALPIYGVEGLVAPQRDPIALASAIALLVGDEALRARVSQAAISRVKRQFDIATRESRLHVRIRSAIAARAPRGS